MRSRRHGGSVRAGSGRTWAAVALLLGGCAPGRLEPTRLMERYRAAIEDAAVARPSEIERGLRAVGPEEPGLIWEGRAGESRLLVATWTSWTGYDGSEGREISTLREVWVTLAPEIQEFCRRYRHRRRRPLTLRLEQLIGVPPDNGRTRFAELWVRPQDLFRPCPDPEITDSQCGLATPQGGGFLHLDEQFTAWFEARRASSYGEGGYPWTRLGYTYDWGNRRSRVGLSEFVIRQGATLAVHKVELTEDYCRRKGRGASSKRSSGVPGRAD